MRKIRAESYMYQLFGWKGEMLFFFFYKINVSLMCVVKTVNVLILNIVDIYKHNNQMYM